MMPAETSAIVMETRAAVEQSRRLVAEMLVLKQQVSAETISLRETTEALVSTMSTPRARAATPSVAPAAEIRADARRRPDVIDQDSLKLLTPRELEVLRMIGEGQRTKEIAFSLGITFKTAVTHRSNIMEKLGIHEGPRLVRFAIRTGVCDV